ncbi:MAG: thiopurine S-methyltransferase [Alphaproteobacteria bacterium]
MDAGFWQRRWHKNEIAFHEKNANPLLLKHFSALSLKEGQRVFVPLCGKTLDIAWLLAQGFRVVGAELIPLAIEQLFAELGVTPTITDVGTLEHYSAENIDIFVGDIFALDAATLGHVDAVYDRAALVALPDAMRAQYVAHLMTITHKAPQLLICYEYDQSTQPGPPFSVSTEEVQLHYRAHYTITPLETLDVAGGLKGLSPAKESVWWLGRKKA